MLWLFISSQKSHLYYFFFSIFRLLAWSGHHLPRLEARKSAVGSIWLRQNGGFWFFQSHSWRQKNLDFLRNPRIRGSRNHSQQGTRSRSWLLVTWCPNVWAPYGNVSFNFFLLFSGFVMNNGTYFVFKIVR